MPEKEYEGLFVGIIGATTNPVLRVFRMRDAREGGMREFLDLTSGAVIGSCGCDWADKNVRPFPVSAKIIKDARRAAENLSISTKSRATFEDQIAVAIATCFEAIDIEFV